MDTILVVNAGSSSVKFQVFALDGEGRLRREIKGQMDGIGSRPRLRASGPTGDTLADRAYPIESISDGCGTNFSSVHSLSGIGSSMVVPTMIAPY
jgi:acetate kinase